MVKKCLNYFFWPKTRKYPHAMFMKKKYFPKKYQKFLKTSEKNLKFFLAYLIVFDWERPEYTHKHYLRKKLKIQKKKNAQFFLNFSKKKYLSFNKAVKGYQMKNGTCFLDQREQKIKK